MCSFTPDVSVEHQPSLQNRRSVNNNNTIIGGVALGEREERAPESEANKLTQSKLVRGVVPCKDRMKPRCLYLATAPNRNETACYRRRGAYTIGHQIMP